MEACSVLEVVLESALAAVCLVVAAVALEVATTFLQVFSLNLEVVGVDVVQLDVVALLEMGAGDLLASELESEDLAGHLEMAVVDTVGVVTAGSEAAAC